MNYEILSQKQIIKATKSDTWHNTKYRFFSSEHLNY